MDKRIGNTEGVGGVFGIVKAFGGSGSSVLVGGLAVFWGLVICWVVFAGVGGGGGSGI